MKHKPIRQSNVYELKEGKLERKRRVCPRCGVGVWMAQHKEGGKARFYCGKCHLTVWE
jgi:small subunit ribosomal protein S27Ae